MQRCRNGLCVAESSSIVYQSGGTNGYVSFLGYEPESRTGVVVLANSKPADGGGVQDIGMHLLDQRFKLRTGLRAPPQHSEVAIDPGLLSRYAGRYQLPQQLATVTAESNHLALLGDLEPAPYLLYPESERDFFSRYQDIQVHFEIDRRAKSPVSSSRAMGPGRRFRGSSESTRRRQRALKPGCERCRQSACRQLSSGCNGAEIDRPHRQGVEPGKALKISATTEPMAAPGFSIASS
jgi:hypothetical protein